MLSAWARLRTALSILEKLQVPLGWCSSGLRAKEYTCGTLLVWSSAPRIGIFGLGEVFAFSAFEAIVAVKLRRASLTVMSVVPLLTVHTSSFTGLKRSSCWVLVPPTDSLVELVHEVFVWYGRSVCVRQCQGIRNRTTETESALRVAKVTLSLTSWLECDGKARPGFLQNQNWVACNLHLHRQLQIHQRQGIRLRVLICHEGKVSPDLHPTTVLFVDDLATDFDFNVVDGCSPEVHQRRLLASRRLKVNHRFLIQWLRFLNLKRQSRCRFVRLILAQS